MLLLERIPDRAPLAWTITQNDLATLCVCLASVRVGLRD
jgi:hypothetical protein